MYAPDGSCSSMSPDGSCSSMFSLDVVQRTKGSGMGGSGLSGNVLGRAEKYAFSLYLSL